MATKTLSIVITGEDKGGKAILDKSAGDVGRYTAEVESKFAGMGAGVRNALIGIGAVAFGRSIVSEAQDAEKAAAQTEAVIKSTGGAANVTAGQVADLADKLSKKSGIDDEVIQSGENMLATFTNVRNEVGKGNDVFDQATTLALDYSVATGTDAVSANLMLGKALNDPIAGMGKLQRAGVTFTAQQKDQIHTLQEHGDKLGAQKIILEEFAKEFGGSAEAQATALDKAQVSWKNFEENVGTALAPGIDALATFGGAVADAFGALPDWAQTGVSSAALLGGAFLLLAPKFEQAWETGKRFFDVLDVTKLVNTKAAVEGIGTASVEAEAGMAGMLGPIALVAAGVALIWSQTKGFTKEVKLSTTEVSGLQTALEHLGTTGRTDLLGPVLDQMDKFGKAKIDFEPFDAKAALDKLKPQLKVLDDVMAEQIKSGHVDEYKREIDALRQYWIASGGDVDWLNSQLDDSTGAFKGASQAIEDQGSVFTTAKVGTDQYRQALSDARTELDKFDQSLNTTYADLNRGRDSVADYYAARDNLTKVLKENGWSMDLATEQGRKNNEALEKAQSAILGVADAKYHETGRTEDAIGATGLYIQSLRDTLTQAGYTNDQVNGLLFTYGLTPDQINTHILTSGTPQAIADAMGVQSAVNNIPDHKTVSIDVFATGQIGVIAGIIAGARATGGPVRKGQTVQVNENEEEWVRIKGGRQLFTAPYDTEIRTGAQMQSAVSNVMTSVNQGGAFTGPSSAPHYHVHINAGHIVTERELGPIIESALRDRENVTSRQLLHR